MSYTVIAVSVDEVRTYIIFSNRHEIRRLDMLSETYVSLVSGLRNTIALDFYYNHSKIGGDNSIIFWTDVIDDKIYKGTLISNCKFTLYAAVALHWSIRVKLC